MEKKTRTGNEFREQAIKLNLHYWENHKCSICNESIGYYFFAYPSYEVVFDSGCGCSSGYNPQPSSWGEVARFYNMQTNPDVIEKMDEFWKWDESKIDENKKVSIDLEESCTSIKLYVARDRDGTLFMFDKKPYKEKGIWMISGHKHSIELPREWFKQIEWKEEEPRMLLLSLLNQNKEIE